MDIQPGEESTDRESVIGILNWMQREERALQTAYQDGGIFSTSTHHEQRADALGQAITVLQSEADQGRDISDESSSDTVAGEQTETDDEIYRLKWAAAIGYRKRIYTAVDRVIRDEDSRMHAKEAVASAVRFEEMLDAIATGTVAQRVQRALDSVIEEAQVREILALAL